MEAHLIMTPSPSLRLGLSQSEAAAILGVTRRTLNNWHRAGYGPQPVREGDRPGARLLYDRAEIETLATGAVA
jgi:DNA-binding transcriptional MerR regulator